MPSLDDFDKRLALLESEIIKEGPRIAQEMAISALAMSRLRIQNEGVRGRQYSTKLMLATQSQFNIKARFKPTEIESTEIGRIGFRNQVAGGFRQPGTGRVDRKGATRKKRLMWIKFKGAKKAVPVMVLHGGYKELRRLNGLQTAHVDFTFTGRMFQNIKLLEPKNQGLKFLAFIGATNLEEKQKLFGLSRRFGTFLDPESDELKVLQQIQANRIQDVVKRVFG
jgi:hypothetical protein